MLTIFTSDTTSVQVSVAELRARQELLMPDGTPALADPFYTPYDYYSDVTLYLSNLTYYAYDHLGNTRVTYTPTGDFVGSDPEYDVMGAFDYYPYGKILSEFINGEQEKFLTTTNERDVESGLDYRWKRFSDSEIGRFLTRDPLEDSYTNWSPYTYVGDNPIISSDPDGDICPPCLVLIGLILMSEHAEAPRSQVTPETIEKDEESRRNLDEVNGYLTAPLTPARAGERILANRAGSQMREVMADRNKKNVPRVDESNKNQTYNGQKTDSHGNKLGPSGKPQVNTVSHSSLKKAKDAARKEGKKAPVKHNNPQKGKSHYHPTDKNGNKIPNSTHHEF